MKICLCRICITTLIAGMCIGLAYGQHKRVGILTSAPKAMLHIADSSVVFTGASTIPSSQSHTITGGGTKFMWLPQYGSIRGGHLKSNASVIWNPDYMPAYTFAFGVNSTCLIPGGLNGRYSIAIGDSTSTIGLYSAAFGRGNFTGEASSAFGLNNYSIGYAFGLNSKVTGNGFVSGENNVSSGWYAFASGFNTQAKGTYSATFGVGTIANGFANVSVGMYNDSIVAPQTTPTPNTPLFLVGNGDGPNQRKNAFTVLNNGKIGINTSAPLSLLHLKGNESGENGLLSMQDFGTGNFAKIYFNDEGLNYKFPSFDDVVEWYNNLGAEIMSFDTESGHLHIQGEISTKGVITEPATTTITFDNQFVDPSHMSYIKIGSTSNIGTDRTIQIVGGQEIGQILTIECTSNQIELNETTSNAELGSNSILLDTGDTIELIWDGVDWIQVSYVNN